jgi:hypothetical protein
LLFFGIVYGKAISIQNGGIKLLENIHSRRDPGNKMYKAILS